MKIIQIIKKPEKEQTEKKENMTQQSSLNYEDDIWTKINILPNYLKIQQVDESEHLDLATAFDVNRKRNKTREMMKTWVQKDLTENNQHTWETSPQSPGHGTRPWISSIEIRNGPNIQCDWHPDIESNGNKGY